jgi:hypothetical protein
MVPRRGIKRPFVKTKGLPLRRLAGQESRRPFVQGRKVDPSAVPPTFGNAALWPTGRALGAAGEWLSVGAAGDSRRLVLPFIAGALRRSLLASHGSSRFGPEAHGSIRSRRRSSFHQPLVLYAGAGRYSSRSQPVLGMWRESTGTARRVSTETARDAVQGRDGGGDGPRPARSHEAAGDAATDRYQWRPQGDILEVRHAGVRHYWR